MDQNDVIKKLNKLLESDDISLDLENGGIESPRKLVSNAVADLKFILSSQLAVKEYSKLILKSDTLQIQPGTQKEVLKSFQELESILSSLREEGDTLQKLSSEFLVEMGNMEERAVEQCDHATNLLRAKQQRLRQNETPSVRGRS